MLKRLANKLVMYRAVQSHLDRNKSIWTSVPAMVITINDFELLLAEIENYIQLTSRKQKGNYTAKSDATSACDCTCL